MTPRPYQAHCVEAIEAGFKEFNRQLLVLPTGGGKTCVFSWLAQRRQPSRTLILAHREELIEQAADKLHTATGITADIEKAERYASLDAPVVVGSIQSLHPERLARWPANHFGLVVCDEAHHAISDSWQAVLRHFGAQVLGVTATPDRGDCRNLGTYFENIAAEVSLLDLISDGYLSRITVQSIPLSIDLSKVKVTAGDFDDAELATALDPYLHEIAVAIREHATFRRTLVFVPLIATSQKFVGICREVGINAEHIDGKSPDRAEILARFAAGEIDLLSNAMLLTEGFDDPGIDCVVVLRPTRSRPLFAQMVGRGTRIAPFKSDLLLLDFLWLHTRHRLVRPAHLVARDTIEADQMQVIQERKSMPTEVVEALPLDLMDMASEAQATREEALRKRLEENKGKRGETLDATDWCTAHGRTDLATYEPAMPWERKEITPGQKQALERAGVDPSTVHGGYQHGRGHANQILTLHFSKQKLVLASPKQRALARRLTGRDPGPDYTAGEFRKLMGSMKGKAKA